VDADGNLTTATQCRESGAFSGYGIACGSIIEEGDCSECGVVILAGFYTERALPCGRTEMMRFESLPNPFGFLKTIETGGGKQDGINLALFEFPEARVHVAAKFNGFDIGSQGEKLRATPLAAGAHDGSMRESMQAVVLDRNKNVAGVDALWSRCETERLRQFRRQVFERVDGKIDAAVGEGFFDLLREHSLGADLGERDFLKAVARGLDDFNLDTVPVLTQEGRDVVRLP